MILLFFNAQINVYYQWKKGGEREHHASHAINIYFVLLLFFSSKDIFCYCIWCENWNKSDRDKCLSILNTWQNKWKRDGHKDEYTLGLLTCYEYQRIFANTSRFCKYLWIFPNAPVNSRMATNANKRQFYCVCLWIYMYKPVLYRERIRSHSRMRNRFLHVIWHKFGTNVRYFYANVYKNSH